MLTDLKDFVEHIKYHIMDIYAFMVRYQYVWQISRLVHMLCRREIC